MAAAPSMEEVELRRQIAAIQTDSSLTELEKARQRQALLAKRWSQPAGPSADTRKGILFLQPSKARTKDPRPFNQQ